jgi:hypothetical protein
MASLALIHSFVDAAPSTEMTCAADDGGEWRRYTSDLVVNPRGLTLSQLLLK